MLERLALKQPVKAFEIHDKSSETVGIIMHHAKQTTTARGIRPDPYQGTHCVPKKNTIFEKADMEPEARLTKWYDPAIAKRRSEDEANAMRPKEHTRILH